MSGTSAESPAMGVQRLAGLVAGWQLPSLAIAFLGMQVASLMILLLAPSDPGGSLGFADEFRIWCFGWDPATGRFEWAAVATTLTAPLLIGAAILWTWGEPLREAIRTSKGAVAAWAAGGSVLALAATFGVAALAGATPDESELPFPAEALRTEVPLPAFDLVDHEGERLRSEDLLGRVTLLTAVYSSCGFT